ncbi:hypothetical protein PV325_001046 [Microctonus aethiopoides]|uniref:Uncharacterized protein n=1 Tax=Microctonus aethiopoides TaxID=144406 RepID=A0AA39FR99_9HYME|nr:hypothetical protein PV325_001046 [Microctonus aethiopoides]KAK0174156.1 hypothetical protein PV328_007265 [Microctonus aethiopoides]
MNESAIKGHGIRCDPKIGNKLLRISATRIHQQIEQKILLENKGVFAITYGWCRAETKSKSSVIIPGNKKDKIKKRLDLIKIQILYYQDKLSLSQHCLDNMEFQIKSEVKSQSELMRSVGILSPTSQSPQIDHEKDVNKNRQLSINSSSDLSITLTIL